MTPAISQVINSGTIKLITYSKHEQYLQDLVPRTNDFIQYTSSFDRCDENPGIPRDNRSVPPAVDLKTQFAKPS